MRLALGLDAGLNSNAEVDDVAWRRRDDNDEIEIGGESSYARFQERERGVGQAEPKELRTSRTRAPPAGATPRCSTNLAAVAMTAWR